MGDPRHDLGLNAEAAVAAWLEADGWRVLARRWRVTEGELDLVCLDPSAILVAIEVRARRTPRAGSGLESIDRRRLRRLRGALGRYLALGAAPHAGARIDLVTVSPEPGTDRWRLVRHPSVDAW